MIETDRRTPPLAVLCVVAVGSIVPASAGTAAQVHDSTAPADTLPVEVDSLRETREAEIDSLRERMAKLSAAIMRLQVRFGVRVQRIESGLHFQLPLDTATDDVVGARGERDPVIRIADLARRYYPAGSVAVLGTVAGADRACGTEPERRRARAVTERLREAGGLAPGRVRVADCVRTGVTDSGETVSRQAPGPAAITILIEWNGSDGSS